MPRHRMPPHRTLPHLPPMERHPPRAIPVAPVQLDILPPLPALIPPALPEREPRLPQAARVEHPPLEEPGQALQHRVTQPEGIRRPLEPEPLAPRTAVKFEPVPTEAAPTCTTPGAAWTSTMVSMAAVASA